MTSVPGEQRKRMRPERQWVEVWLIEWIQALEEGKYRQYLYLALTGVLSHRETTKSGRGSKEK
jgi:hypothetical protein